MLTLLFVFMMLGVFGKLLSFSIRATWGITKILLYLVFLPVILIGLFIGGLVTLAFPILIIVGIVALVKAAVN